MCSNAHFLSGCEAAENARDSEGHVDLSAPDRELEIVDGCYPVVPGQGFSDSALDLGDAVVGRLADEVAKLDAVVPRVDKPVVTLDVQRELNRLPVRVYSADFIPYRHRLRIEPEGQIGMYDEFEIVLYVALCFWYHSIHSPERSAAGFIRSMTANFFPP